MDYEIRDRELELTRGVGIGWVRSDLDFGNFFSSHTEYSPALFDSVLTSVKRHGQSMLGILTWLWGTPWDDDRYDQLIRTIAQTYDGRITHWEYLNEVNLFKNVDDLCNQYVRSLKTTYRTLKEVNPENVVLTSGFAELPDEFISQFSKSDAKDYFDVFNFHSYFVPEDLIPCYQQLAEYMKRDGWNKPVWVTECGMHTAEGKVSVSGYYTDLVPAALRRLGIEEKKVKVGVLSDALTGYNALTEDEVEEYVVPFAKSCLCVSFQDLESLSVRKVPVLFATRSEYFPKKHFPALVDYVRRGGTIVLSGGMPFYYDAFTSHEEFLHRKELGTSLYAQLHMSPLQGWADPETHKTLTEAPEYAGRVEGASFKYEWHPDKKSPARYLSEDNLHEGDSLIPLVTAGTRNFRLPIAGIYKLDSDLKGNIIFQTRMYAPSCPNREAEQARRVARLYISAFAYGVNRVFWYNLRSREKDLTYSEDCFGLIHSDFSEKPSMKAYRTLVKMLPDGSTRPILSEENGIYRASWMKPDSTPMHALWSTAIRPEVRIECRKGTKFYDHLGNPFPRPRRSLTLGSGVIYVEGDLEASCSD